VYAPAAADCVEHPKPSSRAARPPRAVFACLSNGVAAASPPQGYARYDLAAGTRAAWYAGRRVFCEELVVAPKAPPGADADADDDDDDDAAWLLGLAYDAAADASFVHVFDGDDLEAGPVASARLPRPVPHGLHGCFRPRNGTMAA